MIFSFAAFQRKHLGNLIWSSLTISEGQVSKWLNWADSMLQFLLSHWLKPSRLLEYMARDTSHITRDLLLHHSSPWSKLFWIYRYHETLCSIRCPSLLQNIQMTDCYLLSQTQSGGSTRQKGHCIFVCVCESKLKERKKKYTNSVKVLIMLRSHRQGRNWWL